LTVEQLNWLLDGYDVWSAPHPDDQIYACELRCVVLSSLSARYNLWVSAEKTQALLQNKNTELAVRLQLSEEQNRLLREQNRGSSRSSKPMTAEERASADGRTQGACSEEEVRWLKASTTDVPRSKPTPPKRTPTRRCLFNEAEVLGPLRWLKRPTVSDHEG